MPTNKDTVSFPVILSEGKYLTKFERNSFLQYYHMTCTGKTKRTCKPKSSIVSATPRTFHLYSSLQFIQQILWFIVLQFIVHRNLMCKLLSRLVSYISCQYGMSTILQVISHKVSFFSGDCSLKLCSLLKRCMSLKKVKFEALASCGLA